MRPIGPALCLALAAILAVACGPRAPGKTPADLPRADSHPSERTTLGITAFNSWLALVRETRQVELDRGRQRLRFIGVSDEVIPESVRVGVAGDDSSIDFEEQNYDADLITPGRVAEAAVGSRVRALVVDRATGKEELREGTLLGGPRGALIETEDGISALPQDARLVVDEMPRTLVSRPTLSWIVDAPRSGTYDIEVTYLTRGITWRADYVIDLDQAGRTARVQGWATVDNTTALTLADATLQLLAGDVNRIEEVIAEPDMVESLEAMGYMKTEDLPEEEALFEYHLYTVTRPLTIGAREQKQVALVAADGVPFDVTHLARAVLTEVKLPLQNRAVRLSLKHEKDGPMGVPLPGGRAVLWIEDTATDQRIQIGEHHVEHIPVGEPLVIESPGNPAIDGRWVPDRLTTDELNKHLVEGTLTVRNHHAARISLELAFRLGGDPQVDLEVDGVVVPEGYGLQVRRLDVALSPNEEKNMAIRTRRSGGASEGGEND